MSGLKELPKKAFRVVKCPPDQLADVIKETPANRVVKMMAKQAKFLLKQVPPSLESSDPPRTHDSARLDPIRSKRKLSPERPGRI
jgi:hypothetical protein